MCAFRYPVFGNLSVPDREMVAIEKGMDAFVVY